MDQNPFALMKARMEEKDRQLELEQDDLKVLMSPLIKLGNRLEGLSETQETFLVAKLQGARDSDAARAAGVAYSTAKGWKQDPDFRAIYDEVISGPVVFAMEMSAFALAKVVIKLSKWLDSGDPKLVMYAIDKLMSMGGLNRQAIEVTHREVKSREDVDDILNELDKRRRTIDIGDSGGDRQV